MDRVILPSRLAVAEAGTLFFEGVDPGSLEALSASKFAAAAAADNTLHVSGLNITGAGGGAAWLIQYTIAAELGPQSSVGLNAVACGLAGVRFAVAGNASELDGVARRMAAAILTDFPQSLIFQTRVGTAGRDGAYLVGMLFEKVRTDDAYVLFNEPGPTGPFQDQTVDLATFSLPQNQAEQEDGYANWRFSFALATNRPSGTAGWDVQLVGQTSTTVFWGAFLDFTGAPAWEPVSAHITLRSLVPPATDTIAVRLIVGAAPVSFRTLWFERLRVPRAGEPG